MSDEHIIQLAEGALHSELLANNIYGRLSARYQGEASAKLTEISRMEAAHIGFWSGFLKKRGHDPSTIRVSALRLAVYSLMPRLLGRGLTLRALEMEEAAAIEGYSELIDDKSLDDQEREDLKRVLEDELVHEHELAREGSRFEELLAHTRDAVLGMNDGLVEILSVTTGLAGVYSAPLLVALGGLIVAVAGALSMGISTYASVRAQRQVHEGTLRRIASASRHVAHIFRERVIGHMMRKGYSDGVSRALAEESSRDRGLLSSFIANEEYGLREETLGQPLGAGIYAGVFNLFGALVPLIPYFFSTSIVFVVVLSILFATLALSFTGFLVAILAGLSVRKKVAEMILSGLGSASATYVIGRAASILFNLNYA